jgi:hypothetical protein
VNVADLNHASATKSIKIKRVLATLRQTPNEDALLQG